MQMLQAQQETDQDDLRAESRRSNGICERILATATNLFEIQSVSRTYVSDIMRAENLTRELFYYYFADKTELVEKVVESYRDGCRAAVKDAVDACEGSDELQLHAAVKTVMELFYTEDCKHAAMSCVLEELGLFRKAVSDMAAYGATCSLGDDADPELLRKTSTLLLACVGLAEVSEANRELSLGQAQRLISHVLSLR